MTLTSEWDDRESFQKKSEKKLILVDRENAAPNIKC